MKESITLNAEMRENLGTGASRALRREGKVPGIIYGNDKKQLPVAVNENEITRMYRTAGFTTTVINIEVEGKKYKVLPKAVELNPLNDLVRHVDFVYLSSKEQRVEVPLKFEGKERANGVKKGGFFNIIRRKIPLNCPPDKIPSSIILDVSAMGIGSSIKAKNLPIPNDCKLLCKEELVIASITGRGSKEAAETTETKPAEAAKKA